MSRRLRHHFILRGLLAEQGLSYQAFADATGIHKGTVANLCNGRQVSISDDLAERVTSALGIQPAQLFTGTPSPSGRHPDQTAA